ncbi:hypothetical protein E3C22_02655 [Jiella endophytica]|uniref:Uncharacterized protein n=1 Tax=Jiella endophytica TaxID=2558362 RepID=A0A4Y8RT13_9HYPH|nr:hypothetical protein [Jiella endophytica]TFF27376.1 hypothetical protein E3C22_02655 [Jiella endophytica]
MRQEPDIDPPVTPKERADSMAIARTHISACRLALLEAGLLRETPRRRRGRRKPEAAPGPDASDRQTAMAGVIALASIAQGLVRACRRPDCRRAFTCRFTTRRGDEAVHYPPCLRQWPQEAVEALRLGALRMRDPQHFRDPAALAEEAAAFRRREAIAAMRNKPPGGRPETAANTMDGGERISGRPAAVRRYEETAIARRRPTPHGTQEMRRT